MALGNTWIGLFSLLTCVVALWSARTNYEYCMYVADLCRVD